MPELLDRIQEIDWPALIAIWAGRFFIAGLILVAGILIAKIFGLAMARVSKRAGVNETLVRFLRSLTVAAFVIVAAIFALDHLGVNTTSLIAVLGAAGLAIGLALKDSLQNFASSVMIMVFKPFKPGDFIDAAGTSGVVEEIGMFNTWMKTPDNQVIVVPNSNITSDNITNFTHEPIRRISFEIGISYSDQIENARKAILEMIAADDRILPEPVPFVHTWSFGDSSINLMVRAWTGIEVYWDVRSDLLENIKKNFDARGITIPYPQRDIHYYKSD